MFRSQSMRRLSTSKVCVKQCRASNTEHTHRMTHSSRVLFDMPPYPPLPTPPPPPPTPPYRLPRPRNTPPHTRTHPTPPPSPFPCPLPPDAWGALRRVGSPHLNPPTCAGKRAPHTPLTQCTHPTFFPAFFSPVTRHSLSSSPGFGATFDSAPPTPVRSARQPPSLEGVGAGRAPGRAPESPQLI